jgi:hypothetical protein
MNLKQGDLLIFNEEFIKRRKERIAKSQNLYMAEVYNRNLYNIYKVVENQKDSETIQVQFENNPPKVMSLVIFKKATGLDIKKIEMRNIFSKYGVESERTDGF